MQRAALAMFDALGFKGIWRRVSAPEVVVDKLRRMQGSLEEYLRTTFGGDGQPALRDPANVLRSVQATFLSDTVTVAVVPRAIDEVDERPRGEVVRAEQLAASAVAYAATLSGHVMRAALGAAPASAYRGCIAYGEFHMDDRFLVGEAVDEGAERMSAADGAFVWLAPSAKAAFEKSPDGFGGRCTPLTRYGVPLKAAGAEGGESRAAGRGEWGERGGGEVRRAALPVAGAAGGGANRRGGADRGVRRARRKGWRGTPASSCGCIWRT